MITNKNELFNLYRNLSSMVLPDFQKFVTNILRDGNKSLKGFRLSKKELADFLETDVDEINEILEGDFSNVTLVTYLLVLIANNLTLDVHSVEAPYGHLSAKSKYDKVEKKLNEKKNEFLDALNQCKPDSNYLQQLRELAKTNVGNKILCDLIKYYTK